MEISSLNCLECFVECAKCRPRFICNGLCADSKMWTKWPVINYTLWLLIQSLFDVDQITHYCWRCSVKMVKPIVLLNSKIFLKGTSFIILIKGMGTTARKSPDFQFQFQDVLDVWLQATLTTLNISFSSIKWGW